MTPVERDLVVIRGNHATVYPNAVLDYREFSTADSDERLFGPIFAHELYEEEPTNDPPQT
jgi:hypothetical protein